MPLPGIPSMDERAAHERARGEVIEAVHLAIRDTQRDREEPAVIYLGGMAYTLLMSGSPVDFRRVIDPVPDPLDDEAVPATEQVYNIPVHVGWRLGPREVVVITHRDLRAFAKIDVLVMSHARREAMNAVTRDVPARPGGR